MADSFAKYCPVDDLTFPSHLKYCEVCGQSLITKPAVEARRLNQCPRCGNPVEVGVKFCEACGATLQRVETAPSGSDVPASVRCPTCNSPCEPTTHFCEQCGATLSASASAPPQPTPSYASELPHCPNSECRALIEPTAKFCETCGEHIQVDHAAAQVEHQASTLRDSPPTGRELQQNIPSPLPPTVVVPVQHKPVVAELPRHSCPQCNAPMDTDAQFCEECGFQIEGAPPEDDISTAVQPEEAPRIEPVTAPSRPAVVPAVISETVPEEETLSSQELESVSPAVLTGTEPSAFRLEDTGMSVADVRTETEPAPLPSIEHIVPVAAEESDAQPMATVEEDVGDVEDSLSGPLIAEETPKRRGRMWLIASGVSVILIAGLGIGGWYLYQSNAAVQRDVNGFLINIGMLNPVLIVRSSLPGASVLVDGQDRGITNSEGLLTIEGLKKGAHTITVALEGYEKQEKQIDLTAPSMELAINLVSATPQGMVYVPGGTFRMGRDDGDAYERPAHEVTVAAFYIDKHEVTCEEYQKFIDATGHAAPPGWANGKFPAGAGQLPVTGVSWHDANAYARWAGKRLPTEEEWEFAARGRDGRLYPWGNQWKTNVANAGTPDATGVAQVGSYPEGASPFGALDMVGNVWEWTASEIQSYPGGSISEDSLPPAQRSKLKVIRGGCYTSNTRAATTTYRYPYMAEGESYDRTGFRCAKDVEKKEYK